MQSTCVHVLLVNHVSLGCIPHRGSAKHNQPKHRASSKFIGSPLRDHRSYNIHTTNYSLQQSKKDYKLYRVCTEFQSKWNLHHSLQLHNLSALWTCARVLVKLHCHSLLLLVQHQRCSEVTLASVHFSLNQCLATVQHETCKCLMIEMHTCIPYNY